jgi:hypothetical protein
MLNRYLKNTGFKGRRIISLPGMPTSQSGPDQTTEFILVTCGTGKFNNVDLSIKLHTLF